MVENVIIVAVLVLIVGLASLYIYKAKKSGQKCIGCPDAKTCSGACSGSCASCHGCGSNNAEKTE